MNTDTFSPKDLANLIFLLEASNETLMDWWENTTEDDHDYAKELLNTYSEIITEYKLERMRINNNWEESQNILGRIMYEIPD
jgi:hypothetical protein